MTKYILVSTKFEGYLAYAFNKKGYLVQFENCGWGLTDEQMLSINQSLGYALALGNFIEWVRNCGHLIIKVDIDLSFERFWLVFDNARNRIAAERIWKGMTDEQKQYAFYVHEAYLFYLKLHPWCTKMYPDTFLRGHLRDEFYKIKSVKK